MLHQVRSFHPFFAFHHLLVYYRWPWKACNLLGLFPPQELPKHTGTVADNVEPKPDVINESAQIQPNFARKSFYCFRKCFVVSVLPMPTPPSAFGDGPSTLLTLSSAVQAQLYKNGSVKSRPKTEPC